MPLRTWFARSAVLPGAPGFATLTLSLEQWRSVLQDLAAAGGRLVSLWASHDEESVPMVRAAFLTDHQGIVLNLALANPTEAYPGLENLFPAASRMQRAMADLSGIPSTDPDTRPWLRHSSWPADQPA